MMRMQKGIYFDQTRCTGCQTCEVACKDWHDVPAGLSKWIRVTTREEGQFPDLSVSFLVNCCYHCLRPACVAACPVQAVTKREEDGIVLVDRDACIGREKCGLCLEACPYKAPQFRAEPNSRMEKCDLCSDRWGEGKKPICVDSCPTRALDAGPLEELKIKYGTKLEAEGFIYSPQVKPAIIFKPKRRLGITIIRI
jgi:anaerobic dimethyl sulfoxide reductase subunit B (iron-sulfur subunit)